MTAEHDAVVEAMARALAAVDGYAQWESLMVETKAAYRRRAEAALAAVLPLIVGPLRELADDQPPGTRYVSLNRLNAALDALSGGEQEDQSAGRWCETCGQHGSHHTDRHDEMTTALPSEPVPTVDREAIAQAILDECNAFAVSPCRACRQAAVIVRTHGTDA